MNGETYLAGDGHLSVNGGGVWTLVIPAADSLAEQSYDVTATITDTAGNSTSDVSVQELEIDLTPPATPAVAPDLIAASDSGSSSTDNITAETLPTFSVPPGSATPGLTVELFANGSSIASGLVAADGGFLISGSALTDNIYGVRYALTDAAGNQSNLSPALTVTIDTTTAVPTVTSPIEGDDIINDEEKNSVVLTGTAEPGAVVTITFSDNDDTVQESVTADSFGNWTLSTSPVDLSVLVDGSITIDVSATDPAGNTSAMVPALVTLDSVAPATPTVSVTIANTTTPTIVGTAAVSPGDVLIVTVNGISYPVSGSDLTDNGDGSWVLIVPPGDALSEATYDVIVSVTDSAGNDSLDVTSNELRIDTSAPAVPVVDTLITNNDEPVLTGTAVIAPGELLAITVNAVVYTSNDPELVTGPGDVWTLTVPSADALADGTYEVDASVTDEAGNVSTDGSSNELIVDTAAPIAPTVDTLVTNTTTPTITGTASPAAGETLSVVVDSITYVAGDGDLVDNGDGTWSLTIPVDAALAEANYDVDVSVTDAAGNSTTESTSAELVVDTTAPATPVVVPDLLASDDLGQSDSDNITSDSAPTYTVPVGTVGASVAVTLYVDGVASGGGVSAPDGSFSIALAAQSDGSYAISFTETDSAGNESAQSPVLLTTIDTATTVPVIDTPIEIDGVVNSAESTDVLISGSAESGSSIDVSISDGANPAVSATVTVAANGSWTLSGSELDVSGLNAGILTVDATATDVAGNQASAATENITLDLIVPTVTIAAVATDNRINALEDNADVTLSGATTDIEDGQLVTLTLNGQTYTAVVASDAWTTTLPALDVQVLPLNSTLTASVASLSGNAAVPDSVALTHDTVIPEIFVAVVSGDDRINATEDDSDITISGTTVGVEDGQTVTIDLNAQSYTGAVASGAWSVVVPAADLQLLPLLDTLTADVDDLAGNPALTATRTITHDTAAPVVTITSAPIANAANSTGYTAGGTCGAGDLAVTVSISGATPASVDALCNGDSQWFADFDVSAVADGVNAIVINAQQSDAAGNTGSAATIQVDKDTTIPSLNIGVIALDDYINAVEDNTDLSISGTSTSIEDGQTITVNANGSAYVTTVTSNAWSVTVPQADVVLFNSSEVVTADGSNLAGTPAPTATRTVTYDTTAPATPVVTVLVSGSQTPEITGTATLSPGDVLQVTVDGETYVAGDGDLVDHGDGTWTLTIPLANALVEGVYDVTVTLTDVAGNITTEATSGELNVDLTAPAAGATAPDLVAASDTGSADTDNTTSDLAAIFEVPAATLTAGHDITLYADGSPIGTGTVAGDGSFSIATLLPGDGSYLVTYTSTDAAGNESAASPALTVVVDTVISNPVITTPIEDDGFINASENTSVLIEGTAEANASISVTIDDGSNPAVVIATTADGAGQWSLSGSEADISLLDQGTLSVDAVATDLAGNTASASSVTVTHDIDSPAVPSVNTLTTNNTVPVITGTATFTSGDVLSVTVNSVTYTAGAGALIDNGDGTWSLALPLADALNDGTYDVSVQLADEAGNTSADVTTDELIIDTVSPVIPTANPLIANVDQPTLTGTMTLAVGEVLQVTVNSVSYTAGDGNLTDNGNGTWTLVIPAGDALVDDNYSITVSVIDSAGNVSSNAGEAELLIDTTTPATPQVTALLTATATPTINGLVTLGSSETLTVQIDGVTYTEGDGALTGNVDGTWSLDIPLLNALADGDYDVVATVTDIAGNSSTDATALELSVDTVAPVVPTVQSQVVNTATPTINGTASLAAGETLAVTVGGNTYPESGPDLTDNGDGSWTLIVPPADALSQAIFNVTAVVTDAAGNSSVDVTTDELTIDTTAPAVPAVTAVVSNSATPVIEGSAVLAAGETLSVSVNGITYNTSPELVLVGQSWTLSVPTGDALVDGTYAVKATITDSAGNQSTDATTDELRVDTVVPGVVISVIAVDDIINAAEDDLDLTISGTTTDVEDAQAVTIVLDETQYFAAVTANAWSVVVPASAVQALPDNVLVTADVADLAGNAASTATRALTRDAIAPVVSVDAPVTVIGTTAGSYSVSGNCEIGSGDVTVTINAGLPASQSVSCSGAGEWTAPLDLSAVSDGQDVVTVTITQTDSAGNVAAPASVLLDKDTGIPTISILDNGSSGDGFYNAFESGNVEVSGQTSGVENFQLVTLIFDDGSNQLTVMAQVNLNDWTAEAVDLSSLADGPITLTASVSDLAGNAAVPATDTVTLDSVSPLLVANDFGPGTETLPTFSGTTDLPDAATVSVANGGVYCVANVSAGAWSCVSGIELDEGTTEFNVTASDAAGNTATTTFSATVDLDLDSDSDGISDLDEGTGDSDTDGTPDYLDTDSDGDGIDDVVEGLFDSDTDGTPDYLDLDSDNDGIDDVVEGDVDSDSDGIANYRDLDSDNDGLTDQDETVADTDSDLVPDYLDLDSDNDGVADVIEAGGNSGASYGVIAGFSDTNSDGLHDLLAFEPLPQPDTDSAGALDHLALDADGDGIFDLIEAGGTDGNDDGLVDGFIDVDLNGLHDPLQTDPLTDADTDEDGYPNRIDDDSDDDGIPDAIETDADGDSDGVGNFIDLDSDGDTFSDADEGLADLDSDGIVDYLDNNFLEDSDGDGITDGVEGAGDFDGDGTLNYLDADSDGDGIDDVIETAVDSDGDGNPDFLDLDADNDGIPDLIETAADQDADTIPNFRDVDSDNDGLFDTDEAGAVLSSPVDSDADGTADYLDTDSDNDGIADVIEGSADPDVDGIASYLDTDSDGDGLADADEGFADIDADGLINALDADSDDDGIIDSIEGIADTDGDGFANAFDTDSDGDGIDDATEGLIDSDGDALANYIDTDSDNDTVPDSQEGVEDTDSDSIANYLDTDSDGDGIADKVEAGPVPGSPIDTDADTIPDFLDLDADGDTIADSVEGSIDNDGDGIPNYVDLDSDGDGIPDAVEGLLDSDGDGVANYLDLDSDADGVNDVVEAGIVPATHATAMAMAYLTIWISIVTTTQYLI